MRQKINLTVSFLQLLSAIEHFFFKNCRYAANFIAIQTVVINQNSHALNAVLYVSIKLIFELLSFFSSEIEWCKKKAQWITLN